MNLDPASSPLRQRPAERQLGRIHSVPRLLRLGTVLLVGGVLCAVLIGVLATSAGVFSGADIAALLLCMSVIAVAKCIFLFAAYSPCPMCGRFFFIRWRADRPSQSVPGFIPRLLDPNPFCVRCGFQP
jgi:hypothetical protein